MNKNKIILIIVVIMAAVASFIIHQQSNSTINNEITDFAVADTASVTKIFLADKKNNTVLLQRTPKKGWKVDDQYQASQPIVDYFLETINSLAVRKPVAKNAHNTIVNLLASSATKVEIYQNTPAINLFGWKLFTSEKLTKVYYVGPATQNNLGAFCLMEGSSEPYIVYKPGFLGFISPVYTTKSIDWRDHAVFRYNMQDIQAVETTVNEDPLQSFKIVNPDNKNFSLTATASKQTVNNFDTLKIISYLTSFANINFEGFMADKHDPAYIDSVKTSKPAYTISVQHRNGHKNSVKLFRRSILVKDENNQDIPDWDRDKLYALINNDQELVLCQYYTFDKLLRKLDHFTR